MVDLIMEEHPCDFVAAEDMEVDNVHVDDQRTKNSPSLDKHVLLLPPMSDSTYILGAHWDVKVGRFYEIDHSNLPTNCPVRIKCVSIVMVSDKGEQHISLRYPSILSLRMHFNDQSFGKPDGKKIPTLDEEYVMGIEFAIKALCRSITVEEFAQRRNSWSFWASPTKENNQNNSSLVINDAVTRLVSKQGSCWSQLKFTGMMQWGQRRQVRFLGRHEEQKVESLQKLQKEKGVIFEPREGTVGKKRRNTKEGMEVIKVAPFGVPRLSRQRKNNHQGVSSSSRVNKTNKAPDDTKQHQLVVYRKKELKESIDRWSAERYKLAEENMLKVMKEKEAVYGNPIMRADLRSEARKYIGDTGLLDHLLKHMAGKVAPGGVERFRRRHNAGGAMEYWLESADLVDIRKEIGVQDPYWTPPLGWKPGDSISPDHVTSKELREIKEEIVKLKRDMRELASKIEDNALAIVATPSSCLSSLNCDDYSSQSSRQEIYAELVHKKAKIEEQLKEISLALFGMEDQLGILKQAVVEEPIMSTETQMVVGSIPGEDKAAKIERLKSGFQICKPKGSFIWPNMSLSPRVVANLDEHTLVPTPTSASSSTSAPNLVSNSQTLSLSIPYPTSPVRPLAERRPVSTATLTHVTEPFSPHFSSPFETPKSSITTTIHHQN